MAEVAARWDAKAPAWDEDLRDPACHLNEDDAYERFLAEARAKISSQPQFCAREGVLDAGCGTGLVLAALGASFAWGVGIDISPAMVRLAAEKRIPRARFLVADCFELSRHCPPVAAVFSRGVLISHYGAGQGELILREAASALLPGGFVLFDFLNGTARGRYRHQAENKTYFSPQEALALAARAGLMRARVTGGDERRVTLLYAERD
jgi:SAM-dependent methyltransferase